MPTLDLHIDAGALAELTDLPTRILAAVSVARRALADADAADGDNAVGALLAGLQALPGQLSDLPDLDAALGGLAGLRQLLPDGLPESAGGALDALGTLTGLFGPLAVLIDGDPSAVISAAVDQISGLTAVIGEQSEAAVGVSGELHQFFSLLASLDDWDQRPPPVAEVAALVAKAFVGADLDLLAEPALALERCLHGLEVVLPDGADLARWRDGKAGLEAMWAGLEARLTGTIDWPALELDLQAAGSVQAELGAARDRLMASAVAALGRLDLSGLAAVAAALRAVPEVSEVRLTPILDGFVAQLRSFRDGLEHWELTSDDIRQIVRGLVQRLRDAIDHSALGEIRRSLLGFEQRTLALLDGLPLRAIADEITGTLDGIASAIDDVDLTGLLAPVTQLGDDVRDVIVGLGGDAVRTTIGQCGTPSRPPSPKRQACSANCATPSPRSPAH